MGLTSRPGDLPRKPRVAVAKNYLGHSELEALDRIMTAHLDFAELQAMNGKPMYMANCIIKLDNLHRLSDRAILRHRGKVPRDEGIAKAEIEYDRYSCTREARPAHLRPTTRGCWLRERAGESDLRVLQPELLASRRDSRRRRSSLSPRSPTASRERTDALGVPLTPRPVRCRSARWRFRAKVAWTEWPMRGDLAGREAEFLIYRTEEGNAPVDVRFEGYTAWLSLGQMTRRLKRTSGDAS